MEESPEKSEMPIEVASISIDGGRAQIRDEDCGAGAHNPAWLETKVACMQILESKKNTEDPHPELPKIFLDRKSVKHMVEGLKRKSKSVVSDNKEKNEKAINDLQHQTKETKNEYGPKVVKKYVVATVSEAEPFGILVYNKANQKQLHTAKRKAYLGDGDRKIWTIYEDNFKPDGWLPILDFVHAVEYAWDGAKLSTETESHCWNKYVESITNIWQGRVLAVMRKLDKTTEELEHSNKAKSKNIEDKVEKLKSIRGYFKNNYTKMNYPDYRTKGLPVSSCHVESLIKQFNLRIKSTEKFWNKSTLNGVLKIKSSIFSNDNSWQQFWDNRYESQAASKRSYQYYSA